MDPWGRLASFLPRIPCHEKARASGRVSVVSWSVWGNLVASLHGSKKE